MYGFRQYATRITHINIINLEPNFKTKNSFEAWSGFVLYQHVITLHEDGAMKL